MTEGFVHKVIRAQVRSDVQTFDDGAGLTGLAWAKDFETVHVALERDGKPLCGTIDAGGYEGRHLHRHIRRTGPATLHLVDVMA